MTSGNAYNEIIKEVDKRAKEENEKYKTYYAYKQQQKLIQYVKKFCDARHSANRFKQLEEKNPKYKTKRIEAEYFELLSGAYVRLNLQSSGDDVLKTYVENLRAKFELALKESDEQKRFRLYDFICAGCTLCNVENKEIMEQIRHLREDASQIISEIPTM